MRAVGRVCCEEGPSNGVEGQGEDGEDERDESPAGAEGGDDHGGRKAGQVMKDSLGSPSTLISWMMAIERPLGVFGALRSRLWTTSFPSLFVLALAGLPAVLKS